MVDINDVELQVGDNVVFTYATSGNLHKGVIYKFTAQGVIIKHEVTDWDKWRINHHTPYKTISTNLIGAGSRVMKL